MPREKGPQEKADTGMTRFRNKTVWITGASYGLGKSLALHMAGEGWQVAASARTEEDLLKLAGEAAGMKGRIVPCPCDITAPDSVMAAVERMTADFGEIDLAVLNAGTHLPVRAKDFSAEAFRRLTDINLLGSVNCVEAVLRPMRKAGRGQIAIVSSVAGYRGMPTSSAYGMTKAGLINLCEALKPELDRENIRMQVVCPGFVRTPLTDKNDFPMPFLMEPDVAARAFYKGLLSGRFEIVFPWQMGLVMKTLRLLPAPLAFAITKNMIPDEKEAPA